MHTFTRQEILETFATFQYLYRLKYEIRYELSRDIKDFSESVAEHIYSMHLLADYFLKYENPDGTWDGAKLRQMITWHDIDEIETGDTIGWKKTKEDREQELPAALKVISNLPAVIKDDVAILLEEYEEQSSPEAQFVKAIDKIEPMFHLYNERGKQLAHDMKLTREASMSIKVPYVDRFPHIKQFNDHIHEVMEEEGYFSPA